MSTPNLPESPEQAKALSPVVADVQNAPEQDTKDDPLSSVQTDPSVETIVTGMEGCELETAQWVVLTTLNVCPLMRQT